MKKHNILTLMRTAHASQTAYDELQRAYRHRLSKMRAFKTTPCKIATIHHRQVSKPIFDTRHFDTENLRNLVDRLLQDESIIVLADNSHLSGLITNAALDIIAYASDHKHGRETNVYTELMSDKATLEICEKGHIMQPDRFERTARLLSERIQFNTNRCLSFFTANCGEGQAAIELADSQCDIPTAKHIQGLFIHYFAQIAQKNNPASSAHHPCPPPNLPQMLSAINERELRSIVESFVYAYINALPATTIIENSWLADKMRAIATRTLEYANAVKPEEYDDRDNYNIRVRLQNDCLVARRIAAHIKDNRSQKTDPTSIIFYGARHAGWDRQDSLTNCLQDELPYKKITVIDVHDRRSVNNMLRRDNPLSTRPTKRSDYLIVAKR